MVGNHRRVRALTGVVFAALVAACGGDKAETRTGGAPGTPSPLPSEAPLIVYASHNAADTVPVLEAYRDETGRRYQLLTDDMREQEARLANPQLMPEADLFIGASLAELWAVAEADALRPEFSAALEAVLAPELRDRESRWFALSRRARVVAYNSDSVGNEQIAGVRSYGALGDEAWQGQLCVSSSGVPGNKTLIAFMIRAHGVRDAEIIVRRWRMNLAMSVFTNDGTLLNAISDGRCGLGLVDSNILAAFLQGAPDTPVRVHWFDDPASTMTDISGAGVTRHARDATAATELLEWLVSDSANASFSALRFEFPANPASAAGGAIAPWSGYLDDPGSLADLGFLLEEADRLIERARYP